MNDHEGRIQDVIQRIGCQAKGTSGSGAKNDDSDLRVETKSGTNFLFELKERTTNDNIAIPIKFVRKVEKQALCRDNQWAIVYTNAEGRDFVVLDLETFLYEVSE